MGQVKINALLESFSGKVGDFIFRSWNGKTFVSRRPQEGSRKKQSVAQKKNRGHFREMSHESKRRLLDPTIHAHYTAEAKRLKLPNAYTVLLKELLSKSAAENNT